jgi:hypothetical protein
MDGVNLMKSIRRTRTDAKVENNFGEHLNKSLQHHQVVPAVMSSMGGMTSNLPVVRMPNAPASSTGGLRRDVPHSHSRQVLGRVMNHSFLDGRALKRGMVNHPLIRPAHGIKAGGH